MRVWRGLRNVLLLILPLHGVAQESTVWDGVFTEEQAAKGAKLYEQQCIACHSDQPGVLSGHGPSPSIVGEDFLYNWVDSSVADLFDVIRQTMPQAAPNSLDAQQYANITAYLLQVNGFPSGASPLLAEEYAALQNVWIEAR